MKKIGSLILVLLVLLTGCQKISEEDLVSTRASSDEFAKAYTVKDTETMNQIASDRYTIKDNYISEFQKDVEVFNTIQGVDLSYEFLDSKEKSDYIQYSYIMTEKQPTGAIDSFKIQLRFRKIEDQWLVDDYLLIHE